MSPRAPAAICTLLSAAALAASPPARAGELQVVGSAPFSDAELAAAIALRAPGWAAQPGRWQVTMEGGEQVAIEHGGRRIVVALGLRRGDAAARTVALALLELSEQTDNAGGASTMAPTIGGPVGRIASAAMRSSAPPPPNRVELAATVIASNGFDDTDALANVGVAAQLRLRLGDAWFAGAGAALTWAGSTLAVEDASGRSYPVSHATWQVRAPIGRHLDGATVALAPLLAIHDVSASGRAKVVIPGGGAAVEARWALGDHLALVAGAGVDLYAWRTHFTLAEREVAVTSRVTVWVSLGVATRLGP